MKHKKNIIMLLLFSFLLLALIGCGQLNEPTTVEGENTDGNNDSSDAEVTLKLGHVMAEDDQTHKSTLKLAELANEYSNGEIEIKVYPNSQLGDERELVEGVEIGTIDIGLSSNAVVTNFVPSLVYWDLPYIISGAEHVDKILDSEVSDLLDEEFKKENFQNLAVQFGGFRQITNSVRPLNDVDDLSGLNIRLLESKVMLDTFNNIPGVKTSTMDFSELYSGLQQGVVDAQENPINLINSMKFYEVQDYLTLTNHFFTTRYYLMNLDTFNSLTEEQQKALKKASVEAMDYHKTQLFEEEQEILENLKNEGMEVNEASEEFVEEFSSLMEENVYPKYYEQIGNGDPEAGEELIDKIRDLK